MKILYSANNSGGVDWLDDDDWNALERGGWNVDRDFLICGKLYHATKEFAEDNEDFAIQFAKYDFRKVTGQDPDEEGCPCCGPPHNFYKVRE